MGLGPCGSGRTPYVGFSAFCLDLHTVHKAMTVNPSDVYVRMGRGPSYGRNPFRGGWRLKGKPMERSDFRPWLLDIPELFYAAVAAGFAPGSRFSIFSAICYTTLG